MWLKKRERAKHFHSLRAKESELFRHPHFFSEIAPQKPNWKSLQILQLDNRICIEILDYHQKFFQNFFCVSNANENALNAHEFLEIIIRILISNILIHSKRSHDIYWLSDCSKIKNCGRFDFVCCRGRTWLLNFN